ncbi:MAG: hypothetical protein ACK449_03080 [Planctomycetota bacterium]|jgi:hypothetical protein
MNFDPSLILQYLQGAGPQTATAIATFTSFLMDARTFFTESAQAQKSATIDEYLEWLRRQNHNELVDLIVAHREVFEGSFGLLREGLLVEFDRLYAKVDQMHHDLTDLDVDPNRIDIRDMSGWMEESQIMIKGATNPTALRAKFILVNRNRTALTLRNAVGFLAHHTGKFPVKCRQEKLDISGGGASTEFSLITRGKIMYQKGDHLMLEEVSLTFDQATTAITYQLSDGKYLPKSSA